MALVGEMQYLTIGNNTYSLPHGAEPGNTVTEIGTTTASGSSTAFSREDHVHKLTAAAGTAVGLASTGYVTGLPISTFTNDKGYITQGQIPPGAAAYDGPMSKVGQTTAAGSSNAFARGDHVHSIVPSDFGLATTADLNDYLPLSGGTMTGKIVSSYSNTGNHGIQFYGINNTYTQLYSNGYNGTTASYVPKLYFDKPTILNNIYTDAGSTASAVSVGYLNNKHYATTAQIPTVPTNVSAFTNDAGYITGYTETDPVFSVSPAAGITTADISAWNASTAGGIQNLIDGSGSSAVHQIGSTAAGDNSFAEGYLTYASTAAHSQGINTSATGSASHSEGFVTLAEGNSSHAEGQQTSAIDILSHAEGYKTYAASTASHAEGYQTTADSIYSHAEGNKTRSYGPYSHAQGCSSSATAQSSHAEGQETRASGMYSHAQGYLTTAKGSAGHAEGNYTLASGMYSHAAGERTVAQGYAQTVIGRYNIQQGSSATTASSDNAFIIGNGLNGNNKSNAMSITWAGDQTLAGALTLGSQATASNQAVRLDQILNNLIDGSGSSALHQISSTATGQYAVALGKETKASGDYSFTIGEKTLAGTIYDNNSSKYTKQTYAQGYGSTANGWQAHAEGQNTFAGSVDSNNVGSAAHAEGYATSAVQGNGPHSQGVQTLARYNGAHAEGYNSIAASTAAHAQGYQTTVNGIASHAEGYLTAAGDYGSHSQGMRTVASGDYSHAEGYGSTASGYEAHAEGYQTLASNSSSHAEGRGTSATSPQSHAEGYNTRASGQYSHAEGQYTYTTGYDAHAEGSHTTASGDHSHAAGLYTIANRQAQIAIGKYNVTPTTAQAFIIGNGASTAARSNAMTVDWDGNVNLPSTASTYQINNTNILQLIYPIGAIYMSTNDTLPAALVSFGTWTQIKDVFLLAAGDAYSAGSTGGSATIEYTPAGSNGATALSVAQMPSHYHYIVRNANSQGATTASELSASNYISAYATAAKTDLTYSLRHHNSTPNVGRSSSQGSGSAHNHTWTGTKATLDNMPPYKVVYAWQRTA